MKTAAALTSQLPRRLFDAKRAALKYATFLDQSNAERDGFVTNPEIKGVYFLHLL